jgi:predicted ATPase
LSLLYFVAREIRSMRVLLIATCRDVEARLDPEAGEIISRLQREGATLSLRRLDREAAGDLLRRRTGELAPGVEGRIYASTQGNPLFLEEMARLLEDQGPDAITAGVVPGGVRDVIRQRLDRASPEARALLDLAAVAGDEIDVGLLALASAIRVRSSRPWRMRCGSACSPNGPAARGFPTRWSAKCSTGISKPTSAGLYTA